MGHRLSKITTRTGDAGDTGLGDGSRVGKDDVRIAVIGDVDELNSALGVLLAHDEIPESIRHALEGVQHDLFDLGGEIAVPGRSALTPEHVARLERFTEALNQELAPLKEFILPGGARTSAHTHLVRAVCRRAERSLVALSRSGPVSEHARIYLNRLSDLLFVVGRTLNRHAGRGDVLWRPGHSTEGPSVP